MHPPVRIVGRSPVLGVSPALLPAFLEDLAPLCLRHPWQVHGEAQKFGVASLSLRSHLSIWLCWCPAKFSLLLQGTPKGSTWLADGLPRKSLASLHRPCLCSSPMFATADLWDSGFLYCPFTYLISPSTQPVAKWESHLMHLLS